MQPDTIRVKDGQDGERPRQGYYEDTHDVWRGRHKISLQAKPAFPAMAVDDTYRYF